MEHQGKGASYIHAYIESPMSLSMATFVEAQYKRSRLQKKYQEYDQDIVSQRKNRPRLQLSDFNLLRTLGTGSFGRVHLAQSRHNARYYAIKVLKKTEVVRLKQGRNEKWGNVDFYGN